MISDEREEVLHRLPQRDRFFDGLAFEDPTDVLPGLVLLIVPAAGGVGAEDAGLDPDANRLPGALLGGVTDGLVEVEGIGAEAALHDEAL
jgi:hypothetical protein